MCKCLYLALHQVAQPWVEEYIPELDTWVPKAVLSEPRFRYVWGGRGGGGFFLAALPGFACAVLSQSSSLLIVRALWFVYCRLDSLYSSRLDPQSTIQTTDCTLTAVLRCVQVRHGYRERPVPVRLWWRAQLLQPRRRRLLQQAGARLHRGLLRQHLPGCVGSLQCLKESANNRRKAKQE